MKKRLKEFYDKDADMVIRTISSNYTLSLDQLIVLLSQSDHPLPHLVSKNFLTTYQIDREKCRKYAVPADGSGVWMYELYDGKVDPFPSYRKLIYLIKAKPRKIEEIGNLVTQKARIKPVISSVTSDDGSKFWRLEDALMIDKSVSTLDYIYILQRALMDGFKGNPVIKNLAIKLLNTYTCIPDPVDLSGLDELSADDLYKALETALSIFSETMWVIAPVFSLNEIIAITKVFRPDMRKLDLVSALKGEDVADKIKGMDNMACQRLLNFCKTGRFTYTPAIIL